MHVRLVTGGALSTMPLGVPTMTATLRGLVDAFKRATALKPGRPTVCLTMIVKDEAHIIARCIDAVREHIDHWIIVDTGSTDNTETVATLALMGIPGEYHHAPWEGFGKARTRSLELAEGKADYAWIVDADDVWTGEVPPLTEDAHSVWFLQPSGSRFATVRFLRLGMEPPWRYTGVLHEQPVRDGVPIADRPLLDGLSVSSPNDGASWADPEKYRRHAEALAASLADEPTNTRTMFYLAQSWRDHGDHQRAALHYLYRAAMGPGDYWEEVYVSLLEAGRALMRLGRVTDARDALLRAHVAYPARREAMAEIARCFAVMAAVSPTVGTLHVQHLPGEEPSP